MRAWLPREIYANALARTIALAERLPLARIRVLLDRALATCASRLAGLRERLTRLDLIALVIDAADRIEAAFRHLRAAVLWLLPRRGMGLTAALAWRGFAALAGIGATAALVTGLSAKGDATALADLTPLEQAARSYQPAVAARDMARLADDEASWIVVPRPIPLIDLPSPELPREPASYEMRRSRDGTRRQDTLRFGAFDTEEAHLLLSLRSGAILEDATRPFLIGLVRDAAGHALAIRRSSTPSPLRTRFGQVATSDVLLSDGASDRSCIAFRMDAGDMPFALSGWWCAAGKPADRRQLACLIERLDVVNAGDSPQLRAAFSRSELQREPGCAQPRLSASGRKSSWLDADGLTPALRLVAASDPGTVKPVRERKRMPKPPRRPGSKGARTAAAR